MQVITKVTIVPRKVGVDSIEKFIEDVNLALLEGDVTAIQWRSTGGTDFCSAVLEHSIETVNVEALDYSITTSNPDGKYDDDSGISDDNEEIEVEV